MYSAKDIKTKYSITSQTLYNWRKTGKIKFRKLPSGSFIYFDPIETVLDCCEKPRKNVIYARVSNTKQKDDLVQQISVISEFAVKNGISIDFVYQDIASGMNEARKDFSNLIEAVIDGEIETIFISYKDRLTRFGFGYFEKIFGLFGTKIQILNSTKEEDFQQELSQDLISIIHHFSMKLYSNRRKQLKDFSKILSDKK